MQLLYTVCLSDNANYQYTKLIVVKQENQHTKPTYLKKRKATPQLCIVTYGNILLPGVQWIGTFKHQEAVF